MLRRSLSVAALDARILRRDAAPMLVMIVIPLLFVPFLMPGATAQLVAGGRLGATGAEYAVPGLALLFALLNAQQVLTGFFRRRTGAPGTASGLPRSPARSFSWASRSPPWGPMSLLVQQGWTPSFDVQFATALRAIVTGWQFPAEA